MANSITSQLSHTLYFIVFAMLKAIQDLATKTIYGKEKVTLIQSFYQIGDKDMEKKEVPMSSFKGDVLLVVNVASN